MSQAVAERAGRQELAASQGTISERFLGEVERQFNAQTGEGIQFTPLEKRLVQHMFLAVDQALKANEEKRTKGWTAEKLATAHEDPRAFTWRHVDRQKLALDTVHRVSLGLDALVPNHIWPIAYFNNAKGLYDIDLRVGYIGRDYVVRQFAMDPPLEIAYELVYDTDHFKALPRSTSREVEGYEFEISSPFDRGEVVGGFGYLIYDDPRKNRLVLVTKRDFERAQKSAKTNDFWTANPIEMRLKTVYHRVAAKLPLDPRKVNASVVAAVLDEVDGNDRAELEVATAASSHANRELLEFDDKTIDAEPAPEAAETRADADAGLFEEGPGY